MSQPTFPQIDPPLTREGSLNEIISSIAMEELSLSHILNAEGEKLQYVLGTLPGLDEAAALEEVLQVNQSVKDTLSSVMEQQMALTAKLSAALKAPTAPGPAGPTGPTGPLGPGLTSAFAANTEGSTIAVALGGTPIALPNAQVLPPDITANAGNTVFTVAQAGVYQISYHVNITLALLMGTRLVINGANNAASTIAPVVSATNFENQITVNLPANSTISLQMYPATLAGAAALAGSLLLPILAPAA